MKTPLRLSIASVLLAALLGALLLGRGIAHQSSGEVSEPLNQLFPGPLGMADFRKMVSGEFTGDLKRDAVVMDGSRPMLVVAPETFESAITVRPSANDIAVLRGALADPDKDCLVTVSPAGLERYERNSATGTWNVVTIRGSTTSWNNARCVAVGQVDGAGPLDIVGVAADGRSVLIEYGNVGGTYTPGSIFLAHGTGVTDVWLLNWREGANPGTNEIALNSALGVEVRTRQGLTMDLLEWSEAPIFGAVLTYAGTPVQRLALVTEDNGQDGLMVFGDTVIEPNLWMGAAGVVSVATGDADSDGNSEVFLSVNTERKFWMLENLASASPSFDMAHLTKFGYGTNKRNPIHNRSWLLPDDFDSDGMLDVLAAAQGDPGPAVVAYGALELVNVESQVVGGWKASMNRVTYITSMNTVEFRFTRPMTILPHPPEHQTKLGVKVYITHDLSEGTDGAPYFSAFIDMPPEYGYTPFYLPMPQDFSLENSTDLFSFVVRQSARDPSTGSVSDIAPAMTAIFTPEPGVDTIFKLPKTILVLPSLIDPSSSPSFGGIDIGPTVPSMPEGIEPFDPDP